MPHTSQHTCAAAAASAIALDLRYKAVINSYTDALNVATSTGVVRRERQCDLLLNSSPVLLLVHDASELTSIFRMQ